MILSHFLLVSAQSRENKKKIRSSTVTCLLLKLLKEFLKFCHTFFWVFPYCKSNIFVQNGITIFIKSWKNVFNEATFRKMLVPSLSNVNNYVVCIYRKYPNISRNNAAELTTSILSFWVLASSATLFMHFFLHKYGPQINFFCPMMGEVSQHSFIKHIFIWFEKTFYTMNTEQTNQKNFTETKNNFDGNIYADTSKTMLKFIEEYNLSLNGKVQIWGVFWRS